MANRITVYGIAAVAVLGLSLVGCSSLREQPEPVVPKAPDFDPNRIIETYGYKGEEPAIGRARGKQVYVQWCAICHAGGPGMAGTGALMRKYKGELPALLEQRTDLTAAQVRHFVRNGVASMPSFRKVEISDADLETLVLYLAGDANDEGM